MSPQIRIGRSAVGIGNPTYFVADVAANHDGDLGRAKELIRLCAEAGAQAAKFRNFRASTIVSDFGFRALGSHQSHQASWDRSVFDVYAEAALPIEWTEALKETCDSAEIDYFTAPYDLDLIGELSAHVCAWKLGSGDITWHENIEAMAKTGKPLLIATGAAEMDEVRSAVQAARQHTNNVVLMRCNTNYTASTENFRHIALNVLKSFARELPDLVLGLSDHTPGHATVLGSIALGARVVEKHFTDDTSRTGPDHGFSMYPEAWREMVDRTRELEMALGPEKKTVMDNERETVVLQRRAVRAVGPIKVDTVIQRDDLICLRPCPENGLPPYRIDEVVGTVAARDIEKGDVVSAANAAPADDGQRQ